MVRRRIIKIYRPLAAVCAAVVFSAAMFTCAAARDESGETVINISGELKCGHSAMVGIRIFAPDKDISDLSGAALSGDVKSVMPYQNQGMSDEDGKFTFDAEINNGKSGIYTAYIGCSKCGETEKRSVLYSNEQESKDAFELLKQAVSASDEQKVSEICNQYRYALGFVSNTDDMSDTAVREKLLYSYLKGEINDYTADNIRYVYAAAAVSAARSNSEFKSLFDYADELALDKIEIGKFLPESFVTDKFKADMSARFSARNDAALSNMSGFLNCIKDSFILSTVRFSDGYGNITKILGEFKTYIGYTALSSDCAAYISGRNYETIADLKRAIDEYKPSGGGTGGGGGGGSSSGFSNRITPDASQSNDAPQTIDKNIFDDIDDVSWAKEAIISLAQLKIINGRESYKFCPNESITREEAVKILICAFYPEADTVEIPFSDVDNSAWYADFIKKAYGKGIAKGISASEFGVGDSITRQDLAVLCGNILRLSDADIKVDDEISPFNDDSEISDYAKDSIYLLKSLEIVNGSDGGNFEPASDITRAEAAKMIYGLYKYLA